MKPLGPIPPGYTALGGELAIAGRRASDLVAQAGGTPLFVYARDLLDRRVAELRAVPWRAGRVHAFVHGEREQVKAARAYLTDERGVDRRAMSVSAYWAHGRAEDAFQAEKKTPLGQIFPDGSTGG